MTPRAAVVHELRHRVRIRIAGAKNSGGNYFQHIESHLKQAFNYHHISVSPITATVLLIDPALDLDAVAQYCRKAELFDVNSRGEAPEGNIFNLAGTLLGGMDRGMRRITGNKLDTAGSVFLILIFHAMVEMFRGNLKMPSWFTALWMACTLYNRQNSARGIGNISDFPVEDGGDSCE